MKTCPARANDRHSCSRQRSRRRSSDLLRFVLLQFRYPAQVQGECRMSCNFIMFHISFVSGYVHLYLSGACSFRKSTMYLMVEFHINTIVCLSIRTSWRTTSSWPWDVLGLPLRTSPKRSYGFQRKTSDRSCLTSSTLPVWELTANPTKVSINNDNRLTF